ncbi:efflux RND transporter periplasmic adaptor subunit [Shewanella youngdeokensis]|uniref:Efflux RND transporter periplasmic adaptor subunit n=1 Tax=Shewanella youngdeokensis TaxID=2999068 RepID=A0ABZ0K3L6_9GAMM|nr:efflux RND transporter periplasmic adaptor subunit [Shewanella sp. DAU334]
MTNSTSKIAKLAVTPLALVMVTACNQAPSDTVSDSARAERPVQVMMLTDQHQANAKQFSGVLQATKAASLSFKVSGTIEAILVKPGDKVEQGQVLARLDPHDYQVTVIELEARLAEATAAHQLAKVELKRVKQAIADDAISKVNLDRAQSGYQRSLAMVDVVTQNLQKANDALRYTELVAPFSGVIGSKSQHAFEQTSPGAGLFSIHQPNQLKAVIDVPENLINKLTIAQPATVTWHGNDTPLSAKLTEMNTLADPIKQTYAVQFGIDQPQSNALPGKAVTVSVNLNSNGSSYCVPYAAIKGQGDDQVVYIVNNQKIEQKLISVESMHSNRVCISGDIKTGDAVVTAGVHYLSPLQAVVNTVTKTFSY